MTWLSLNAEWACAAANGESEKEGTYKYIIN